MHLAEWQNGPLRMQTTSLSMSRALQSNPKHWQISSSIGLKLSMSPPCLDSNFWQMHFDGSKMKAVLGASIVLTSPKGDELKYVLQIHFATSNKVAEYEALVHGVRLAKEIGIRRILCYGD